MLRFDPLADSERLIKRVYAYVAYRIGDGADAEDVTSETFERAVRYKSSYDRSKGEPISWLLGIARRCIEDSWKHRLATTSEVPDVAAAGALEDETENRLLVAAALARLNERDRELIALRYGADLTARQIGNLLGLRANAVEVALHRTLGRLREAFEAGPLGEAGLPPPEARSVRI